LNKKQREKHISVEEDTHNRLRVLAQKNNRTLRGMLLYLIAKEEKETK
jgi:macrodomain Ter protein organizer (MatP/YcbG family)